MGSKKCNRLACLRSQVEELIKHLSLKWVSTFSPPILLAIIVLQIFYLSAQNANTAKKAKKHIMQPVSSAKGASFSPLRHSFSSNANARSAAGPINLPLSHTL